MFLRVVSIVGLGFKEEEGDRSEKWEWGYKCSHMEYNQCWKRATSTSLVSTKPFSRTSMLASNSPLSLAPLLVPMVSLSLSLSLHFVLYLGMDTNVINSFRQPSKCLCDSKNSNLLFNFIFGIFFLANYRTFRSSSSLVYLVFRYGHKCYQSFRQPVCDQWCCHLIIVIVSLQ